LACPGAAGGLENLVMKGKDDNNEAVRTDWPQAAKRSGNDKLVFRLPRPSPR